MPLNYFSIGSSFLLGAIHSLEPGHGKSIMALGTSQSKKISDGFSLLASLLLTHFSLTVVVSSILYFNPEWAKLDWIRFAAPFLIIGYGLFLLIKSNKNRYIACSCDHSTDDKSQRKSIQIGIMAGLTPCPSVFAPVMIGISNSNFSNIFYFLFAYMLGVIAVFLSIFLAVILLKRQSKFKIEHLIEKFNPHLISGSIMILIGLFYLYIGLCH